MGNGTERIDAVLPESYYLDKAGVRTLWEKCKGSGVGGGGSTVVMTSDIYSHEERVVGKYINEDGLYKPVYQRTFSFTSPSTVNTKLVVVSSDILHAEELIGLSGWVLSANGFSYLFGAEGSYYLLALSSEALVAQISNVGYANQPATATIQWIKTTDSWSDTKPIIDGGSSEEIYTTEERRIGTWIDGKPLYRLSIETTVENPGTASAIMELPAEAEVKMFQGFAKRVDNGAIYSLPNTEPNDVGHNISCYYEYSKIMVWAGSEVATRLKNGKFWAIAEYTKTTDS